MGDAVRSAGPTFVPVAPIGPLPLRPGSSANDRAMTKALVIGAVVAGLSAAVTLASMGGVDEEAVRAALKVSGRLSLLLFLVTLVTGPLASRGVALARALVPYRGRVGMALAGAQVTHAILIGGLLWVSPDASFPLRFAVVGGFAGYLAILAMAVSSFSWSVRWLGAAARARIHAVGAWYLIVLFVYDLLLKPAMSGRLAEPSYWPFALLLVAGLVLKLWSRSNRTAGVRR